MKLRTKVFLAGFVAVAVLIALGAGHRTMVAAEGQHRKCYGIEISENYCAVILQRMKDAFPALEIKKLP